MPTTPRPETLRLTGVYFRPSTRRNGGEWVAALVRGSIARHVTLRATERAEAEAEAIALVVPELTPEPDSRYGIVDSIIATSLRIAGNEAASLDVRLQAARDAVAYADAQARTTAALTVPRRDEATATEIGGRAWALLVIESLVRPTPCWWLADEGFNRILIAAR